MVTAISSPGRRRRRTQAGMTLIEVMISLLLGTIGLLGMLMLVLSLSAGSLFSRQLTEASVLAQSKAEELVSSVGVTLTTPADGDYPSGSPESLDAYGRVAQAGPYQRRWNYSPWSDAGGSRRRVTVTVRWQDTRGTWHTVVAVRDKVAQ
jgi:prepilin-type N-terminal cleavage/methylation domain-containing protein